MALMESKQVTEEGAEAVIGGPNVEKGWKRYDPNEFDWQFDNEPDAQKPLHAIFGFGWIDPGRVHW